MPSAPSGRSVAIRHGMPMARDGGARALGDKRRKKGGWWLVGLIVLLVAAGLVYFLAFANHSKSISAAHKASASAPSPGKATTGSASDGGGNGSSSSNNDSKTADLVGGGGVGPKPATGALTGTNVRGTVLFAESGAVLDSFAQEVVAAAAAEIRRAGDTAVSVVGYTDSNGNAASNQQLSLQRAHAVVMALRTQLTGSPVSFQAQAEGQALPIASNATPQGQQLNRRVVIEARK